MAKQTSIVADEGGARGGDVSAPARIERLFFRRVRSRNVFEEAFAQMARAVRLGAIAPGSKFPAERELANRLGVSRATIREAIRALEQTGFVETRRGRFGGTFVVDSPRDDYPDTARFVVAGKELFDTLDFRAVIEPGAAALAAARARPEHVDQMKSLMSAMEKGSKQEFVRNNCHFHILLGQAADCGPLINAIADVELRLMDLLFAVPKLGASLEHSREQHWAIVDAIEKGDAENARESTAEHLGATDIVVREFAGSRDKR